MSPELRPPIAKRARDLQNRIRPGERDVVPLATEARKLFEDASDELRSRWLTLELSGYAGHVDTRPLSEVLGVLPGDLTGNRLLAHIAAYRTQRGYDVTPGRPRQELQHFFVEPLAVFVATAEKLSSASPLIVLDFAPSQPARSAEFGRDVFLRILAGFCAALHLQLADRAR